MSLARTLRKSPTMRRQLEPDGPARWSASLFLGGGAAGVDQADDLGMQVGDRQALISRVQSML